ncbi:hypothetical protein PAXRUDRAFT_830131 [Paxillus rubicundulus Ve08.2h10]|uniref:Unplaced genomic scaffold scaffold_475, whole genome shotgun sequence n=1 Tax=Paxillus rubicundulus Ve08.2h10 TaxID=930991 RepID=A0A0D0DTZ5_9AGAM|nr:hypothetical protein PAXRUDRAFT_830131 [Paxillus rubicundulus Ve08.2h10]
MAYAPLCAYQAAAVDDMQCMTSRKSALNEENPKDVNTPAKIDVHQTCTFKSPTGEKVCTSRKSVFTAAIADIFWC